MSNKMKYFSILPCVLVMGIIFLFSSRPAEVSTNDSMFLTEIVYKAYDALHGGEITNVEVVKEQIEFIVRKTAHAFIYCVLSVCYCIPICVFSWNKRRNSNYHIAKSVKSKNAVYFDNYREFSKYLFAVVFAFLYACSDEFHQSFVDGRSCEFKDVMIDTAGATFGALCFCILLLLIYKRRCRQSAKEC